jgi:hypothetical protein
MRNRKHRERGSATDALLVVVCLVIVVGMIFGGWAVCKNTEVWSEEMSGKAELAKASQNRQIAVNEAQAKLDAAKLLAQAEAERAKGVAEANKIIGDSLKGNDSYLRYLWIMSLENGNAPTIVYVPTEANLPIMEASRFVEKPK